MPLSADDLFDVTVKPWIAAAGKGNRPETLSLRDILTDPHRATIALAGEPPVRVGILRLMLAILHDALQGPPDDETWAQWWNAKAWPVEPVDAYLKTHAARMRLFDPDLPFMQTVTVDRMPRKSVSDLVIHRPSGNNPVWLSHNTGLSGPNPLKLTPGEAAGWIIASHQFSRCGLFPGPNGRASATQAVLTNRHISLPAGRTLTETLLLNLTCYTPDPFDVPPWRTSASAPALAASPPNGLVQLLSWKTRLILLEPAAEITECVHAADPSIPTDINPKLLLDLDPHLSFREDRKDPSIIWPVTCDPGQSSWRVLHALLGGLSPVSAVSAAQRRTDLGYLIPGEWAVAVAGVAMEAKAKPVAWHYDTFPPVSTVLVQAATEMSAVFQSALRKATGILFKELGSPAGADATGAVLAGWWRGLDRHAQTLLRNLSAHDTLQSAEPLLAGWQERLRITASETLDALCSAYPPDIALKGQATARRVLYSVLAKEAAAAADGKGKS